MSPLQILNEQLSGNVVIVTLIGQMDESNVDIKAPEIYEIIEKIPHGGALIMNLSGLEYMNSKSIGYTTDFFNKMNEKEGTYIIAEAQDQIMDILNVVGLTQVITFLPTVKEAKEKILGVSINESKNIESKQEVFSPIKKPEELTLSKEETVNVQEKTSVVDFKAQIAKELETKLKIKKDESSGQILKESVQKEDQKVNISEPKKEQEVIEKETTTKNEMIIDTKKDQESLVEKKPSEPKIEKAKVSVVEEEKNGGIPILLIAVIVCIILLITVIILK